MLVSDEQYSGSAVPQIIKTLPSLVVAEFF